jgi:hypothetical protein
MHELLVSPTTADFVLQLLASRCLLLHQHLQQQQQQQQVPARQLSRQLGRHMRGDLLLLPNAQQQLQHLLPGDTFLAADAAVVAELRSSSSSSSSSYSSGCDYEIVSLIVIDIVVGLGDQVDCPDALLAPRLQLSVHLVLLTAVHWQQIYHSLTQQQQQALLQAPVEQQLEDANGAAAAGGASDAHEQLHAAQKELHACCTFVNRLWRKEQWQPLLQLVQQQEGEVLLQGLTLALHCTSLNRQFAQQQRGHEQVQEQEKGPIRAKPLLRMFSVGMYVCGGGRGFTQTRGTQPGA